MEPWLAWLAPATCIIAALMVAANAGTRITGYGFIVFSASSAAWVAYGVLRDETSLIVQNAVLLAINLVGIWRWLGLRLRYERGAWRAALRARRRGPAPKARAPLRRAR
jgi:hypothetical protein